MAQNDLKSFRGIKKDEPLSRHTTFGIGGPAGWFYEAKSEAEITSAIKKSCTSKIPYFILGGGSNLLVSDEGFFGLVIKNSYAKFKIVREDSKYKIFASSGLRLADLVNAFAERGLFGVEFLTGIPGTVGGAIRGNAGAWQQEIGDLVEKVKILNRENKAIWVKKNDCHFSYRSSRFKNSGEVILEVKLVARKGDKKQIERKLKEYQSVRNTQPKKPSAGCVFINPKPEPAGRLIDQCGLKGRRIGDAQISTQHANFIINLGKAKAGEVLELINLAKKEVLLKFGVELKEEICLIGFDRMKEDRDRK